MRRFLPLLVLLALLSGCSLTTADTPGSFPTPEATPTPPPYRSSCTLEEAQPIFEAHKEDLELFRTELSAAVSNFDLNWWGEDGALECRLSPLDGREPISTSDWTEVEGLFPHIRVAAELIEDLDAHSLSFAQYGEGEEAYAGLRLSLAYWFYQAPESNCGAYTDYRIQWTVEAPDADAYLNCTSLGDGWYYCEMQMP